ncbi:MAG: TonB-dependent receptor [Betaproteobacteria bacterium]|nr:TonB-dependent receptor [Betaproteobacteria bacterium]
MKTQNVNAITASPLLFPLVLSVSLSLSYTYTTTAHAQITEPPNRLDNVVITATRTAQPLDSTLAQAAIITRDEIESAGVASLTELLQRKAGLEIRATGGPGQPSSVFIRGANSAHTLVLVDGLRVGASSSGATAFEHIPLDLIERVEIVKGPLSGLYGSDAIGGVIQIFTRAPASGKPRLTASIGAGSDSTVGANAGFSITEGKSALTFDAGYQDSKSKSATNPAAGSYTYNPDRDPYQNTHALVKLTHTLWQGEVVGFTAWQSRGKTNFDSGPTDPASNKQTLSGYHLTSENKFSPDWKSRLIIGRTTDDSVISSTYAGNFKTEQNQANWFNEFKTAVGHMTAGIEWRGEKLISDTAYDAKKRDTTSIFAGYLERIGPAQFEFTLRRDEEAQFGQRNTGSASYGYTLTPGISAYVRVGRAFRAPSFNDLYYPGFNNPNLKPEQSDQAEAGLRLRGTGAQKYRVDVVHFENRIDDLIVAAPITYLPENLSRARIRGWEIQADTSFVGMTVKATLTVQRPEDRDTGDQIRSRAKRFGSLSASRNFGKWDVSGDIVASGARFDSSNEAPATRMGGYTVVNANLRYRIDKTWSVELVGQNLADKKYELAQGYNTPSRSVFLNVRAVAF